VIRKLSQLLVVFIVTLLRINHSFPFHSKQEITGFEYTITMATTTAPIPIDDIISGQYYSQDHLNLQESEPACFNCAPLPREPLRFYFKGYSIWLELNEVDSDVTDTIQQVAKELGVLPIPSSHVTVAYGIDHLTDDEILLRFDQVKEKIISWPTFRPRGVITDIELEGVSGGLMDMAWTEISFATSPEHEHLVSSVHQIFGVPRKTSDTWLPHLSLAYDNPENTALSLAYTANIIAQKPTLFYERNVKAISLWSTQGKMADWKFMSRYEL